MTSQLVVPETARARAVVTWRSAERAEAQWAGLRLRPEADAASADVCRRMLNILVALLGLVVAVPLMLAIAALVKLTSPGPVLFHQTRVGLDRRVRARRRDEASGGRRTRDAGGRLFRIYKFRTMRVNGADQRQVWARPDDPRITPVGAVLRRFRLDELPQLFNVLRGDMNIVGPRPEQPLIFADLRARIPAYALRQIVRPGITGWAQINHHYDQSMDDVRRKVTFDLEYIARRDALEDLKIMLRTLPVMLGCRGGW